MPSSEPSYAVLAPPTGRLSQTQIACMAMAALAALYICWPLWRAFLTIELNGNEPWNAWFADRAFGGGPLYPKAADLIVNNYPPLSFYFIALLSKLTGDVILTGRLVSIVSTLALGIACAFSVRALGGSRGAAALGGFWVVATLCRFFTKYVGMDDPNLLALAIMAAAFALFLARSESGKSVEPAIAAMVIAGFFKHNLFALPATALIWLYVDRRDQFWRAATFGLAASALGLAICLAAFGMDFLDQLLMPRPIQFAKVFQLLNKIQWVAPALAVWGVWAWRNPSTRNARLTALLVAISLFTALAQSTGVGVAVNIYLELVFATGVAVALAFEGLGRERLNIGMGSAAIQASVTAILVVRLLLSQQLEPYLVITSPAFRQEFTALSGIMNKEIERVHALPGAVSCSVQSVCYRAGQPFLYDGFWVERKIEKGVMSKAQLDRAVAERGIRFEENDQGLAPLRHRIF